MAVNLDQAQQRRADNPAPHGGISERMQRIRDLEMLVGVEDSRAVRSAARQRVAKNAGAAEVRETFSPIIAGDFVLDTSRESQTTSQQPKKSSWLKPALLAAASFLGGGGAIGAGLVLANHFLDKEPDPPPTTNDLDRNWGVTITTEHPE